MDDVTRNYANTSILHLSKRRENPRTEHGPSFPVKSIKTAEGAKRKDVIKVVHSFLSSLSRAILNSKYVSTSGRKAARGKHTRQAHATFFAPRLLQLGLAGLGLDQNGLE